MKKTILFTVIMMLFSLMSIVGAQIHIGATAGTSNSNFKAEKDNRFDVNPDDFGAQTGFDFGAVIEVPTNPHFSLRAQLMFLQRGSSYEEDEIDMNVQYKLSYLEIPIFIKAAIGRSFRPYVLAGGSIGYNTRADAKMDQAGFSANVDYKKITEDFNINLAYGAGISYELEICTVFIEGLINHGSTNINQGGNVDFDIEGQSVERAVHALELKTYGLQIMAGVTFPISKTL
jgi:hypothetical protein